MQHRRLTRSLLEGRVKHEPFEGACDRLVQGTGDSPARLARQLERLWQTRPLANAIPIHAVEELFAGLRIDPAR